MSILYEAQKKRIELLLHQRDTLADAYLRICGGWLKCNNAECEFRFDDNSMCQIKEVQEREKREAAG